MTLFTKMQSVSFLTLVLQLIWNMCYTCSLNRFSLHWFCWKIFYEVLVEKEKLHRELSGDTFYYVKSSDVGVQIKQHRLKNNVFLNTDISYSSFISVMPLDFSCSCWSLRAVEYRFRTVFLHVCIVPSHWCLWLSELLGTMVIWKRVRGKDTLCLSPAVRIACLHS